MASILLQDRSPTGATSHPKVAIIDTTGSFPVSLLAKIIKTRILQARSDISPRSRWGANETANYKHVDAEVQRQLGKVNISRVFDIEGLWDVLGEVTRNPQIMLGQREDTTASTFKTNIRGSEATSRSNEIIVDSQDEDLSPSEVSSPEKHGDEGIEILVIDSMTDIINGSLVDKEKSEGTYQVRSRSSTY